MKSISIYVIAREQKLTQLSKLERQLSGRDKPLKMKDELAKNETVMSELEELGEDTVNGLSCVSK